MKENISLSIVVKKKVRKPSWQNVTSIWIIFVICDASLALVYYIDWSWSLTITREILLITLQSSCGWGLLAVPISSLAKLGPCLKQLLTQCPRVNFLAAAHVRAVFMTQSPCPFLPLYLPFLFCFLDLRVSPVAACSVESLWASLILESPSPTLRVSSQAFWAVDSHLG